MKSPQAGLDPGAQMTSSGHTRSHSLLEVETIPVYLGHGTLSFNIRIV